MVINHVRILGIANTFSQTSSSIRDDLCFPGTLSIVFPRPFTCLPFLQLWSWHDIVSQSFRRFSKALSQVQCCSCDAGAYIGWDQTIGCSKIFVSLANVLLWPWHHKITFCYVLLQVKAQRCSVVDEQQTWRWFWMQKRPNSVDLDADNVYLNYPQLIAIRVSQGW